MGPRATVDFYDKLVTLTPADSDQEHLRVIIWADPTVPNRQDAILSDGRSPAPWLRRGMQELVRAGAEILVMPCNTAHRYVRDVRDVLSEGVEFIDIVDVTMDAVRRQPSKPSGCSPPTGPWPPTSSSRRCAR
ncbi:MAG: aspartate/glutamate racemase family protein [Allobranchiibius sp.]